MVLDIYHRGVERVLGRVQARQLLTDPAVAREFARLREEAEAKAQEVRRLQEELQAVNFSQESKAGRLLMAKCRALQVHPHPAVLCAYLLWFYLFRIADLAAIECMKVLSGLFGSAWALINTMESWNLPCRAPPPLYPICV